MTKNGCVRLRELDVRGSTWTDATLLYLKSQTNFEKLSVTNSEDLYLSDLSNLRELSLESISQQGLADIASCNKKLHTLKIESNQLTDVQELQHLPELRVLECGNVRFTEETFKNLQLLTKLHELRIPNSCIPVTDDNVHVLCNLIELRKLDISNGNFKGKLTIKGVHELIKHLAHLEELCIKGTCYSKQISKPPKLKIDVLS